MKADVKLISNEFKKKPVMENQVSLKVITLTKQISILSLLFIVINLADDLKNKHYSSVN